MTITSKYDKIINERLCIFIILSLFISLPRLNYLQSNTVSVNIGIALS